ncbi:MAG: hypothetical protein WDM77_20660 [Steroidobacteraceae bacterium]
MASWPRCWPTRPPRRNAPPAIPGPFATFTTDQAAQGQDALCATVRSCHGKYLSGSEFATPLNGNAFSLNWGGKSAGALFTFIHDRMPPGAAGSLSPDAAADLLAYLLQVNGSKPGTDALAADATVLGSLTIARSAVSPAPADDAAVALVATGAEGVHAESTGSVHIRHGCHVAQSAARRLAAVASHVQ